MPCEDNLIPPSASADTMTDMVALENNPFSAATAIAMTQQPTLLRYYRSKTGDEFYSLFFLALTHEKFTTASAKKLWDDINLHHSDLSNSLQRDPGFVVALCDYLLNFSTLNYNPLIIDARRSQDMLDTGTRDALTGLFRRQVFDEMLLLEFEAHQSTNAQFALLMIDIDDFKQVNDQWGHQKGDEVLQQLGELLLNIVRKEDVAARYGGEELVILMPDCQKEAAMKVAKRIREEIANQPISDIKITVSIGLSLSDYDSAKATLKAADDALYKAKNNGKNQVQVA